MRLQAVRRHLPIVAVALTAAVAFPLGVIASHQFSDVPTSNTFHADIAAIAEAGVTTGCGAGKYCPKDFVTREQMAAFLNRLGALGPGKPPVVNADKVDGHDEVLPAGDIVIPQHGPWQNYNFGANVTIAPASGYTTISALQPDNGGVLLTLQAPGTIGGVAYGVASVEVCLATSTATVTTTRVYETNATSVVANILDLTERTAEAPMCYTVTDPMPDAMTGGPQLFVTIDFPEASTYLQVGTVATTWTPVD
jgi:hypothetical protein